MSQPYLARVGRLQALDKWWEQQSLRQQYLGLSMVIGTVPLLAIGVFSCFLTQQALSQRIIKRQEIHVQALANELKIFTERRYQDILVLSELSLLNSLEIRAKSKEQAKAFLDRLRDEKNYDNIAVAGANGKLIVQSKGDTSPPDFTRIDYFKSLMSGVNIIAVKVRKSMVTQKYSIFFAGILKDPKTGKISGIVRTRSYFFALKDALKNQSNLFNELGSTTNFILDIEGVIIYSNRDEFIGKRLKEVFINADTITKLPRNKNTKTTFTQNVFDRENQILSYTLPEKNIDLPDALGWSVVTAQPTHLAFSILRNLILVFTIGIITSALLVLCIVIYLANQLVKPFVIAAETVAQIGNGDLDARISISGAREISSLGTNINCMANYIQFLIEQKEIASQQIIVANRQIHELNTHLNQENQQMRGELAVTHKLQQMILPSESELSAQASMQIAGFMEPTDTVGGDYYDVIQFKNRLIISIGDVTGHGLESGVMAIMAQTAVQTLSTIEGLSATVFHNCLNQVLYRNVRRMGSDKSMTLAVLSCEEGTLTLSGQHESLIVVRNTGEIEEIDTIDLGFPLALEEDISPFIATVNLNLTAGDTVVLYTDGIPEAENSAQELYGLERLKQILANHYHLSAAQIRQAILDDLMEHIDAYPILDDITLVIAKQL